MEPLNPTPPMQMSALAHYPQSILLTQVQGPGAVALPLLAPGLRPGCRHGLPLTRLSCSHFPPPTLDIRQCHDASISICFHQLCSGTVLPHQSEDEPKALPSWCQLGWCSDTYRHMVSWDDSFPQICYYPAHTLSICLLHFIIACTKSGPNLFYGRIPPLERGRHVCLEGLLVSFLVQRCC